MRNGDGVFRVKCLLTRRHSKREVMSRKDKHHASSTGGCELTDDMLICGPLREAVEHEGLRVVQENPEDQCFFRATHTREKNGQGLEAPAAIPDFGSFLSPKCCEFVQKREKPGPDITGISYYSITSRLKQYVID